MEREVEEPAPEPMPSPGAAVYQKSAEVAGQQTDSLQPLSAYRSDQLPMDNGEFQNL